MITKNSNNFKFALQNASFGYAYYKVITDKKGKPIDYLFLEINPAFEKLTGLTASKILNRKVSEVLPQFTANDLLLMEQLGEIAIHGGEKEFDHFSDHVK